MNQQPTAIINQIYRLGRPNGPPLTICAAAKGQSLDKVCTVVKLGVSQIGENYVQEAQQKYDNDEWRALKAERRLKLRLIGHLQSNKVKQAINIFDSVDTVHSAKLAVKLNRFWAKAEPLEVLMQYNPLAEATKEGLVNYRQLLDLAQLINDLNNLQLKGLMVIAPNRPDLAAATFKLVYQAYSDLKLAGFKLDTLSMGMSGDYEPAIAAGSTMVRLGTALFGSRL
ncbi:MAG: YggS family pyridoxal phosphate-dependent enzyme [Spirochaetaceae bacterium]|nr:YggS family pyridoxal phosphate-dependent enzyme [Spirochaetaceae bacterium]